MADITVALDAGHGGSDPGAVYQERQEKDDVLRLTRAVGQILEDNGINVFYVREDDEYEAPFKKATDANASGADYFVSIHRNSSESPNQYNGIETLVYRDAGAAGTLARNINSRLENVGFNNLGVDERPNLVVLRRTQMPAVLVEAGFINTDKDNELFDTRFNEIAEAIADGILDTIYLTDGDNANTAANELSSDIQPDAVYPDTNTETSNNLSYDNPDIDEKLYRVQVGAYRNKENADRALDALLIEGFPAFIIYDDGFYKVQVGAFRYLTNAIKMERRLRHFRYNTYIVYD